MQSRRILAALALGGFIACAAAQEPFPTKPIRVVVPSPAGGANDVVVRTLAEKLTPDNHHLAVGARVAGAIARRHGDAGLPPSLLQLRFRCLFLDILFSHNLLGCFLLFPNVRLGFGFLE